MVSQTACYTKNRFEPEVFVNCLANQKKFQQRSKRLAKCLVDNNRCEWENRSKSRCLHVQAAPLLEWCQLLFVLSRHHFVLQSLLRACTHTPATNTGCVAISEESSLWREGASKCTPPEAQPGCMHKQQGSTSGGDFERPKVVQVSRVCMLGIDSTDHSRRKIRSRQFTMELLHTPLILFMCGSLCAQTVLLWWAALGKAQQ